MYTKNFQFQNGDEVTEKITGFTGIITGTCFYLTGCNQYLITAKSESANKEPIALWYDEGRIELVGNKFSEKDVVGQENGCDIPPTIGMRGA